MSKRTIRLFGFLVVTGMAMFLWGLASAQAQNSVAAPQGLEVLARGPIHEAFAGPVTARPPAFPIVRKRPPDPIPELPAEQRPEGENVIWIPGYFAWDDERDDYIYVSGFWRVPPPGRQWFPGHWQEVAGGWQWSPGYWAAAEQAEIQYLPPPPDPIDAGPSIPAPSADSNYVPGCWVFRDGRYWWRPGFWVPLRPGWVWIPARYIRTPIGYIFVNGYWDYPLGRRGLLFAPVYFSPRFALVAGWQFRPSFVVYSDFLLASFFVRPGYCHYYFGDYYDPLYTRLGFMPWFSFFIGPASYDPLFSYYRRIYRDDPRWERDLRALYMARRAGEAPRPPRTLEQQNALLRDITEKKTLKVGDIRTVTALAPITKVDPKVVKLQPLDKARAVQEQKIAEHILEAANQRRQAEAKLLREGPLQKPTDAPRSLKLTTPLLPKDYKAPAIKPPPLPAVPKVVPTPPIRRDTPPMPPRKDVTPPPRKETTPPIPPPRKETTPPPKKDGPPKKESKPVSRKGGSGEERSKGDC